MRAAAVALAMLLAVAFAPWASAQSSATGDVDCDAILSVGDVQLVARFVLGEVDDHGGCPLPEPGAQINAAAADLDGDGAVGTVDALFLLQCALGFPAAIDCPAP